ncbi:endonuclease/exonuclease/phosphatase family protein [Pseudochryseolinea flava]|uniref:Endonuclease n=1 Tax=Pseudochryseolinea flava TaxID=2059302 RepID=A0A364XWE2_9BACT|nr:endonuclease/exonuclease/phosphatase family protein [Pseudochryseolinea flava]RAV98689.1 endonuclease [Pseudochryseolinea flava]
MKRNVLFFFLASIAISAVAQPAKIATYNMRYDNVQDTVNAWAKRVPIIGQVIQFHEIELFGAQELLDHQVKDVKKQLPMFDWIGVGRDDGQAKGEYAPIFYHADKFKVLDKGNFWLSETPDQPTKGWDAALPRICSWGKFQDLKTKKVFFIFNTHFDHKGELARINSAKLILDKIKTIAGNQPVVLMGDFNFDQRHEGYQTLQSSTLKDAFGLALFKLANTSTFNGFDIRTAGDARIDHILVSPQFKVSKYGILTDSYQGKLPSDHFPVTISLSLSK